MDKLIFLLFLATLVQFVVQQLKVFIPPSTTKWAIPILALIISVVITIGCQIGVLSLFSITLQPLLLDYILSGLIISGGSTGVNELIKVLQNLKETMQNAGK